MRKPHLGSLCFGLFLTLALVALPTAAQQQYCLTDLGSLHGNTTRSHDINNETQIVGLSWLAIPTTNALFRGFYWQDGSMEDAGGLEPDRGSTANRINNYGWIVGTAADANGISRAGYSFAVDGAVWWEIPGLGISSEGWGVNDNAWMVGTSVENTSNGSQPFGFAYHPRFGVFDLGSFGEAGRSEAYTINNNQTIGGVSYDLENDCGFSGGPTPVIWTEQSFGVWSPTVLPTGGNCTALVMAISEDDNTAVGFVETPVVPSPLLWSRDDSGEWSVELLATTGQFGIGGAMAINASGQIAGFGEDYAALWQNGNLIDLNQVTELPPGWNLGSASGINDHGEIAGTGTVGSDIRGFLLKPKTFIKPCP